MYPILLILFIMVIAITMWPSFYRWAFFPKRDPDFEHRLYIYWFDEKVAYGRLTSPRKMKFFERDGVLYEDFGKNEMYIELFNGISTKLDPKVQKAYQQHIHKQFEKIVLNPKDIE